MKKPGRAGSVLDRAYDLPENWRGMAVALRQEPGSAALRRESRLMSLIAEGVGFIRRSARSASLSG